MSRPYSLNSNSTQLILTAAGIEQLPITALRVPPTVGFQSVTACGGALGLCIGSQACYVVGNGLAIICGLVTWPVVAVVCIVVAGVTICYTLQQLLARIKALEDAIANKQEECNSLMRIGQLDAYLACQLALQQIIDELAWLRRGLNFGPPGNLGAREVPGIGEVPMQ